MAPDLKGRKRSLWPQRKVFLTFLLPFGLQKRWQPLRSRPAARLSSADPDLALRTWLKGRVPSSGVLRKKGKKQTPLHDKPESDWSDDLKAKYLREGVQMVLGGPVTKNIRQRVKLVFESDYCKDVEPEQGLVNYIFRGVFTQGLDSEFFMVHRSQRPAAYPVFLAVYNQDGLGWSPAERYSRSERQAVTPTEAQLRTLANGTELTNGELQQFARGLVVIVDWVSTLPVYPPMIEGWTSEARKAHLHQMEYRMVIMRYDLALADSIMSGTCPLNARGSLEYRLLVEFYWMLH
jgi:hypothetical protein